MKEGNQHIISDEQLFKYFSGDISLEEKLVIDNWSSSSEINKNKFQASEIFFLDLKAVQSLKTNQGMGDTDMAWDQIKSKRNTNVREDKGSRIITLNTLKYAASILIVLLGSWFFYNSQKTNSVLLSELEATNQTIEKNLEDGSTITLNQNSSISYPESFDKKERKVSLKGEAYFDITSNPEQPFLITTQNATIKVLGTSFNVDSRNDGDSIVVTVDTGKVLFSVGNQQEMLLKGNMGVYVKNSQRLYQRPSDVDLTYDFWRTKRLVFNHTKLSEAIDAINQVYQKKIVLSGENFSTCKISVEFIDEELADIIDVISSTLNLEVIEENGHYVLKGNGCD